MLFEDKHLQIIYLHLLPDSDSLTFPYKRRKALRRKRNEGPNIHYLALGALVHSPKSKQEEGSRKDGEPMMNLNELR